MTRKRAGRAAAIVALAGIAALARPAAAQTDGVWQVYLYANEVRDLAARGEEVWAATSGGVVRYVEGEGFTQFNRETRGLLSDSLRTVAVDGSGALWFGSERAGISIRQPRSDLWLSFTRLLDPIPSDRIRRVRFGQLDGEEALLVGTESGYAVFVGGDLRFVCQEGVDICLLPSFDVRDLRAIGDEVWLATASGVTVQLPDGTWEARSTGIGSAELTAFSPEGPLWAAGPGGVWEWDGEAWVVADEGLPEGFLPLSFLSAGDELWLAGEGPSSARGVFRRSGEVWERVGTRRFPATSLTRTDSGRIFAGASDDGEQLDGIWEWDGVEWTQRRLEGPSLRAHYRSLAFDPEGRLWFSTAEVGKIPLLGRYNAGRWSIFNGGQGGAASAWTFDILASGGSLWLAHCCCAPAQDACRLEQVDPDGPTFLAIDGVREGSALDEDPAGNLWLSTNSDNVMIQSGIWRLSGSERLNVTRAVADSFRSNQVAAILAGDREVWIGYYTAGLSRWRFGPNGVPNLDRDPEGNPNPPETLDDQWKTFTTVSTGGSIIGNSIRVIRRGADGRIWIGTTAGISIYDGLRFENIGPRFDRFPSAEILDIATTPDGGAWISCRNGGITRMTPRPEGGFDYETFGPPDLPNPNVETLVLDPDGRTIWAGTDRGLASFLPFAVGEEPTNEQIGAYPNPFDPSCADGIRVLGAGGQVSGTVSDLEGRILARFDRRLPDETIWDGRKDGRPVAPGLYLVRLRTPIGLRTVGVAVSESGCGP